MILLLLTVQVHSNVAFLLGQYILDHCGNFDILTRFWKQCVINIIRRYRVSEA